MCDIYLATSLIQVILGVAAILSVKCDIIQAIYSKSQELDGSKDEASPLHAIGKIECSVECLMSTCVGFALRVLDDQTYCELTVKSQELPLGRWTIYVPNYSGIGMISSHVMII